MNYSASAKKIILWFIAAAVFFAAAAFLRFGPVRFSFAWIFAGVGCLMLVFGILKLLGLKKIRRVLAILVVTGLFGLAAIELVVLSAAHTDKNPEADYLIVLGAGLNGTAPSLSLVDRLIAALEYLREYPDAVAIVSGGQGENELISEALAMKIWLEAQGVDSERIIMEERSTSTQENLKFSFEIIRELGGDPADGVAICTSEYHLYRAKHIAGRLGAQAAGVAGETSAFVLKANYMVREAFAIVYLWVFGV